MSHQPLPPRARRLGRAVIALLTSIFIVLLGAVGASTPARAGQNGVTVTLSAATASVVDDAASKISLAGTLANTSGSNLSTVQAYVWRDTNRLNSTSDVASYLSSPDDQPIGTRWVNDQGTGWVAITTAQQPTLQPGQSASFVLSTTLGELGLRGPGVYPIGVQIRAQNPDGSNATVGRARTMITVLASKGTTAYTPLVLLTAPPTFLGGTTFKNLDLVTDLSTRLTPLLNRARQANTTVLIDPALVDEVTALTAPFTVANASTQTPTPTQQAAIAKTASAWLAELQTVLKTHDAYRLTYGNADLSVPVANNDTDALNRIRDALTSVNITASLPLLILARGSITPEFLAAIKFLDADVVLGDSAPDGVDQSSGMTLRRLASNLSAGGPGPAPRNTLSQQVATAIARAHVSPQPLAVALSSTADLTLDAALRLALTASPLVSAQNRVTLESSPLTPDRTWEAARNAATKQFGAWGDLTNQRPGARVRLNQALARSLAQGQSAAQRTAFVNQAVGVIGNVLGGKLLYARLSPPDFVLSSQSNELPASVTNKLDSAVTVRLAFTSENPQRISIPQTELVTIPPGETVTVHFAPHAYTNGSVTAWAQLQTPSGRAIGDPIKVTISATSFGEIGWIIIIVSGVIFLGATALRVRQVQKDRAANSALESRHTASTFPPASDTGQTVGSTASEPQIDASPNPTTTDSAASTASATQQPTGGSTE